MDLWPLAAHFLLVAGLTAVILVVSWVLGQRHREKATGEVYESGIEPTGGSRGRLGVDFFLVALLFVIFDLEVAFLFAWAVAARDLGWAGYVGFLVFVAILVVGFVYEWRRGALDWGWSAAARERAERAREASREAIRRNRGRSGREARGAAGGGA